MRCCLSCKQSLDDSHFYVAVRTKTKDFRRTTCKSCKIQHVTASRRLRKQHKQTATCCALCGRGDRRLELDHDHESGRFRGWLCSPCNRGLGLLGDDLSGVERARMYLIRNERSSSGTESGAGLPRPRRTICRCSPKGDTSDQETSEGAYSSLSTETGSGASSA